MEPDTPSDSALDGWSEEQPPPGQLDLDMIEIMHPDPDGYLPILRKDPARAGKMQNVFSGKMGDLREWLPALADQLMRDSYMALNTFREPWKDKHGNWHYRGKTHLSRLCSCYVDLDHDDYGLSFEQAFGQIGNLIGAGRIPWPSIMARSGNGMYIVWLLNPVEPQRDNLYLHYETERRLITMMEHIGGDHAAKDASRIFRLPGSWNTKTGPNKDQMRRVQYIPYLTADGDLVRYDLPDLAERVSFPLPTDKDGQARPRKRIQSTARKQTVAALIAGDPLTPGSLMPKELPDYQDAPQRRAPHARVFDLVKIAEDRGGIIKGRRTMFLRYYAQSLTAAYSIYGRELWDRVWDLNLAACCPPMEPPEIYNVCRKVYAWYMTDKGTPRAIRADTIIRALGITAADAKRLDLHALLPTAERTRRRKAAQRRRRARAKVKTDRLATIAKMLDAPGRKPSLRALGAMLSVSHQQIKLDLAELGYTMKRDGSVVKVT